jgi:putative ATPase
MSQSSLFQQDTSFQPLAEKLRPKIWNDLVGSIIENQSFISWIKSGAKSSAIFYGPPGTGKTSIAELVSKMTNKECIKLYAFDSGVKDLREVISRARKIPASILLFVDEVHNFNKNQQDVLLDAIEKGYLSFIGATTENPAISINKALLSRVLKFELEPLREKDLEELVSRAFNYLIKNEDSKFISEDFSLLKFLSNEALEYLINSSFGDARTLINNIEIIWMLFKETILSNNTDEKSFIIRKEDLEKNISSKHFSGDSNTYYNCISALQKSMRGSDPNASIYWLARLLSGGAELASVARRILVTAAEDVGLADPQALVIANAAHDAALKLGMPEAKIPLAQAVAYIAQAPKSNLAYKAIGRAMQDCENHPPYPVPVHLRSANATCPAKSDKYKKENPITNYKYPHDYEGNWVEQEYMPEELKSRKYFA